ncbi:MAG TPA: hydrogenase maturation nickel metallochaperone HypA [Kiritimatiellia bacterium]|nr:hydrogenase maturation nickel metallochaperone HypA [Kiritimatiellia bacterium]
MHEFGIAENILEAAQEAARANGARRIEVVRVRVGALSGVVEEALRFAFDSLANGTPAAGARLEIEPAPVRCYCDGCNTEFAATPLHYECPACGRASSDIRGGRELNLIAIEVS